MPRPPSSTSPFWRVFRLATRLDAYLLRATGGRRSFISRAPTLVLHDVGRRSGQQRVTPLIYLDRAPDLVVVASKGGTDRHPAWFHNLTAMTTARVDLPGGESRVVRPRVAGPEEKAELWPRLVELFPDYATYATYTERDIPVVVLEPDGPAPQQP
jgi:deazaflavin-dependent oxidoreductase (nitroreductase family)